jgi:hypothetical protein
MPDDINTPTKEQIEIRAYELYLARGSEPGRELDDWLEAEAALRIEIITRDSVLNELKPAAAIPPAPRKRSRKRAAV